MKRSRFEAGPKLLGDAAPSEICFDPGWFRPLFFKGGKSKGVAETVAEQQAAMVAAERWNYYQTDFGRPQEEQYKAIVKAMDTDGAYDYVEGVANKAYQPAASEEIAETREMQRGMGMDAGSSRSKLAVDQMGLEFASGNAGAKSKALLDQKDRYLSGLENVVNIGQGKSVSAQTGLSDIANASAEEASRHAVSDFNKQADRQFAVGNTLGMGGRALIEGDKK